MTNYTLHENQSLLDVSAHVYGRVDLAFDLAMLNKVSVTEVLPAGMLVQLVNSPVTVLVKKALDNRGIVPATGFSTNETLLPELGIGTMAVGTTFIVG